MDQAFSWNLDSFPGLWISGRSGRNGFYLEYPKVTDLDVTVGPQTTAHCIEHTLNVIADSLDVQTSARGNFFYKVFLGLSAHDNP